MDLPEGARLHIHLDPVGGVAGDMFIAAMLDAFPALEDRVAGDIAAILPDHVGHAALTRGLSGGMAVRRFALEATADSHHHHDHEHGHHDHHGHGHHRHGEETTYRAMRAMIEAAPLSDGTAARACAILHLIAEAEAAAHDIPIERVHFHELADWDALMDVTAAGSIAAALEGASWSLASLPLGGGMVRTAHGMLPVPAPATARILKGYAWHDDGVAGERVTPTGAAIVAHLTRDGTGIRQAGRLAAIGMGAGTRELPDRPNILRVTAFDISDPPDRTDQALQLACDIDDMTGEEIGAATEALRALPGVIDLVLLSAQGKKARPVTRMELLLKPQAEPRVVEALFDRTSTLGLRRTEVTRLILPRSTNTAPDGKTRRKIATRPSGVTFKAESDDLDGAPTLAARRAQARLAEDG
ncbi:LarC family nickel insertion protein [Paracoccus methylarcula]|uniref:LarC family nickel insertion protein n=1 Tax=Paracoccus methylarcula TaxID=72022 RepID=A0A422QXW3_9RHOB|nr:LarC family nickel insertion protein [Paracoccus methylarcula]RNF34828.1 LarC family nickel insertion protein [Paracoccus methylarcula]